MNEFFISLYLDTRRKKKSGKYPVKLRVFTTEPRKQKLYPTKFEYTEEEFRHIWTTKRPEKKYREERFKLQEAENFAHETATSLNTFTFERFEQLLFKGGRTRLNDIVFHYNEAIERYKKNDQIGTASNYSLSLKSLLGYHGQENLPFYIITPQWLKEYENSMLNEKKRSRTTVGIYLRPLRSVFNSALAANLIDQESYPFGKRKYQIPEPQGVKKALSREQLKKLFKSKPVTPEQKKAKAFWFFSYSCNGMNIKDIANLRYSDISGDIITFRRAKTINTIRKQAPIIVFLNDFTRKVIDKYGNSDKSPNNYVFDIVDHELSAELQHNLIKNFTRFINQHIEKLAKSVGIDEDISSYWARHSYATNAVRSGASLEYVSESMGHQNLSTTKTYFAGFEDDKKREIAKSLMKF